MSNAFAWWNADKPVVRLFADVGFQGYIEIDFSEIVFGDQLKSLFDFLGNNVP